MDKAKNAAAVKKRSGGGYIFVASAFLRSTHAHPAGKHCAAGDTLRKVF